jgi:Flp pilus assembly protein TadD
MAKVSRFVHNKHEHPPVRDTVCIVDSDPNARWNKEQLVSLFGRRNKLVQASGDGDRARRASEAEASGLKCLKDGNLASAEVELRRCVDLNPTYALGHGYLGLTLYRLGRLPEAEAELQTALVLSPTDEVLCRTHGMILEALGRLDEAAVAYINAVSSNPNSARAHAALGSLALKRGDLASAEDSVMTALQIDPTDAQALSELADIRQKLGNRDGAISTLRQAIISNPNNPLFRFKLGSFLAEAGQIDGAVSEFRHGLERKPHDPDIMRALSLSLIKVGADGEVQAIYERAMRAMPQNTERYEADLFDLLVEQAVPGRARAALVDSSPMPRGAPSLAPRSISPPPTPQVPQPALSKPRTAVPPAVSDPIAIAIGRLEAQLLEDPNNTRLYRDLSIQYMRTGRLAEAKEMARTAESLRMRTTQARQS